MVGERLEELVEFTWSDPGGDRDLLLRTRAEAVKLLAQDPGLKRRSSRPLLQLSRARVGEGVDDAQTEPSGATGAGGNAQRKRRRRKR